MGYNVLATCLLFSFVFPSFASSSEATILRRWHTADASEYAGQEGDSCAMIGNPKTLTYRLANVYRDSFEIVSSATTVQAITHAGTCGPCSSLADLAVLKEVKELPPIWWKSGIRSVFNFKIAITYLRHIGFTASCSKSIVEWTYEHVTQCPIEWATAVTSFGGGNSTEIAGWMFCETKVEEGDKYETRILEKEIAFERKLGRVPRTSGLDLVQWSPQTVEVDHDLYIYPGGQEAVEWVQPDYPEEVLQGLRFKRLLLPYPRIILDPYLDSSLDLRIDESEVCAIQYHDEDHLTYTLHTFEDEAHAVREHAIVTHKGACGACSTLQDLAVYMGTKDLTNPVRKCAFKSFVSKDWAMECLQEVGFSPACADIWYWNTQNTRRKCLTTCFFSFLERNNYPDGSLSPCIQCDEDISGPVFKKVSARTRRNSGLLSAIQRPGPAVYRASHHHHSCAASTEDDDVCVAPKELAEAVNYAHENSLQS